MPESTLNVKLEEFNPRSYDLVAHLYRQRAFSRATFGPGDRLKGVLHHIRREIKEVEESPGDIDEWADLVLLALDGAWRQGFSPEEIASALRDKQGRNEERIWPDWRTAEPDKAIEHVKNCPHGMAAHECADCLAFSDLAPQDVS